MLQPQTNLPLPKEAPPEAIPAAESTKFEHSWRLWCVFLSLCLLSFMGAIDSTVTTTALPTITREIGGSDQYVWIANAYLFTSTVPQPLYAQIADIFGRRNPMIFAIALFVLGSGVAGGATGAAMLIAGRTVQGLGTGGLYVLSDIIICDLVPPRFRGPYLSAVLGTAAIGTTVGPIIGGAFAQVNWRWVFWLNLPISGVGLLAILFFLHVRYTRSPTWAHALARVDFLGNAIFIPAMVAVFFALIMGGTRGYPWHSWRIIVPLVLGVLGWIAFHIHQASPICREPSMPTRLFTNRTSCAGFLLIFLGGVVLQAINYFLPIYFQGVKGVSPLTSGVYFLPFALAIIPLGGLAGAFLSKTGLYKPLHLAGFALCAVGAGLLSTLGVHSGTGAWAGFQVPASAGVGLLFTATLPSTLAALPEADVAVATGTYSFVRSLGLVWGVTVASSAFNGRVDARLGAVADPSVRGLLRDGGAYAYASEGAAIAALPGPVRGQVLDVYAGALRVVWLVCVGFSCLGFLLTFVEAQVPLRTEQTSEFGLTQKQRDSSKDREGVEA